MFNRDKSLFFAALVMLVLSSLNALWWSPPKDRDVKNLVRIESGQTVSDVAHLLKKGGLIRSEFWLRVGVALFGESVKAGDYYFEKPVSVFTVSYRISKSINGLSQLRITVPEGLNKFQIGKLMDAKLPLFDKEKFEMEAKEGYLFPDTYFFLPNATEEEVISKMTNNFDLQTAAIKAAVGSSTKKFEEIINLASIVEREAKEPEDRRTVAGILLTRLRMKHPLQVDAAFEYVNGKNTYTLEPGDLEIDSPYNTYKYVGLPPTPISNPGLESIKAAFEPRETDYLYFLSDLGGNVYYARTFDEHQANRELYLRK